MKLLPGVFQNKRKNGCIYYRSSITFQNKHISLGSFHSEEDAHKAYQEANYILYTRNIDINSYNPQCSCLSYLKWVVLINYRDHLLYFKTPIYLQKNYFEYHFDPQYFIKFDVDDLFYYSNHKIMKRGGHLFVQDYGMQVNILSRYGIKNYAVCPRDYRFVNGDSSDFRYANIQVINKYYGVTQTTERSRKLYVTKIHIRGNYVVGKYSSEVEAAIAYNKAVEILKKKGVSSQFSQNYITEIDEITYATIYNRIPISKKILYFS